MNHTNLLTRTLKASGGFVTDVFRIVTKKGYWHLFKSITVPLLAFVAGLISFFIDCLADESTRTYDGYSRKRNGVSPSDAELYSGEYHNDPVNIHYGKKGSGKKGSVPF